MSHVFHNGRVLKSTLYMTTEYFTLHDVTIPNISEIKKVMKPTDNWHVWIHKFVARITTKLFNRNKLEKIERD